jgi:hypothetical protein
MMGLSTDILTSLEEPTLLPREDFNLVLLSYYVTHVKYSDVFPVCLRMCRFGRWPPG